MVTANPELDDNNSLIRFLLYSTDYDIEGLICTSSGYHWKGDGKGTNGLFQGGNTTALVWEPVHVNLGGGQKMKSSLMMLWKLMKSHTQT
ncbi:nucleoside hydrolase-like domain-containing protein [Flagellimonas amoyensis]|uniref:nucleoside hydrolase-like domain-containing protein n=1 Tax=Flagellimonas amoyensis TaxID=2169401 RepID=UPI003AAD62EC